MTSKKQKRKERAEIRKMINEKKFVKELQDKLGVIECDMSPSEYNWHIANAKKIDVKQNKSSVVQND